MDALKDVRFPGNQNCANTRPLQIVIDGLELGPDGDVIKLVSAITANEEAKLKLLVALFRGQDASQATKNVVRTELQKYKIAVDQGGKIVQATLDEAVKEVHDGAKLVDGVLKNVNDLKDAVVKRGEKAVKEEIKKEEQNLARPHDLVGGAVYDKGKQILNSDLRLKADIVRVGSLSNGIVLYSFRYLWSDQRYVGVLAQEIETVVPDAVSRGPDGFLRVDYGQLGIEMLTWQEWVKRHPGDPTAASLATIRKEFAH